MRTVAAHDVLGRAGDAAARAGVPLFLVGGAVRDLLLRTASKDVDLAAEGPAASALALARRLAAVPGWRLVAAHERFGTATLDAPGALRVDVAATRTETYPRPAALPVVSTGASIGDDLSRRDFTIHAMARRVGEHGELGPTIDPHGGRGDLRSETLRLLHDRSLVDDPTRAFRAIRYAVRLGFRLEPCFGQRLRRAREAAAFPALSGDRLRRALFEVLREPDVRRAVELLTRFALLDDICPGWSEDLRKRIPPKAIEEPAPPFAAADLRMAWILGPLSSLKRTAIAERLRFSRALRRSAGIPRR
jgi:tRNA nucleotidyltransferase (CCA-adding enzyme)